MFLKVIIFLAGISVLALCILLVPEMANFAANLYPNIAPMKYLVFIVMYGAAVPFYVALYQAFNLLQYIDENTAFSELSVRALKNIKRCAITISGLYVLSLPLFYFIAKKMDPPIGLVGLIIVFASLVISVFAAILQRLLQEAINIKSENNLTV
ncbi:putative membrane protein [Bacillus cereus]|nr:putative membrane protein [Bacillus cereus]